MSPRPPHIRYLHDQSQRLGRLVQQWSDICTGTHHLPGLAAMADVLGKAFEPLGDVRRVTLPPHEDIDDSGAAISRRAGDALHITRRPDAARRVMLCIHMDTVFGPEHPFQKAQRVDDRTLRGPGVVDAKGGLAVMLAALEAFERSDVADRIGWHVVINPDEEVGSPCSDALLAQVAQQCHVGMVFEPTLTDGAMVNRRGGSGNFTVVLRGRAAHAGRDFTAGRNAVVAASRLAQRLDAISSPSDGLTVNVARLVGGGPNNRVPDLAVLRLNVRYETATQETTLDHLLHDACRAIQGDGITAALHGRFYAPPKPVNDAAANYIKLIESCGLALDEPVHWQSTRGVCDGNRMAAAGLTTIDTFGPRGGGLHSEDEYLQLDSLVPRAQLAAMVLTRLAEGAIDAFVTPSHDNRRSSHGSTRR